MLVLLLAAALAADGVPEPDAVADPAAEAPPTRPGVLPLPLDAVVLIHQGPSLCAGAFIDDQGTVATAYHCVSSGGRPEVQTHDGRRAVGRVVGTRVRSDIALIAVPDLAGSPWLPARETELVLGETVRAIGHPYGVREQSGFMEGTLRWSLSQGVVAAFGPRAVQFTAPVNPGNSGGPVIDDEGRLVGIVSRRLGGEALSFAGRVDAVQALAAEEPRGLSPIGGTLEANILFSVSEVPGGLGWLALGGRLEASLRDRVVIGASWAPGLSPRWTAARFGSVSWSEVEARAGLRQRFLRGQRTLMAEAYGGVSSLATVTARAEGGVDRSADLRPMFGAAVGYGGAFLDVALIPTGDPDRAGLDAFALRAQVVLRWPGVFWMF